MHAAAEHALHEAAQAAAARGAVAMAGHHLPRPAAPRRAALQHAIDHDLRRVQIERVVRGAVHRGRQQQVPAGNAAVGEVVVVEVGSVVVVRDHASGFDRGGVAGQRVVFARALAPRVAHGHAAPGDAPLALVLLLEVTAGVAHCMYPRRASIPRVGMVMAQVHVDVVPRHGFHEAAPARLCAAHEHLRRGVVMVVLAVGPVHLALAELVAEVQHAERARSVAVADVAVVRAIAHVVVARRAAGRLWDEEIERAGVGIPVRGGREHGRLVQQARHRVHRGNVGDLAPHGHERDLMYLGHALAHLVSAVLKVVVELQQIDLGAVVVLLLAELGADVEAQGAGLGPDGLGVELPKVAAEDRGRNIGMGGRGPARRALAFRRAISGPQLVAVVVELLEAARRRGAVARAHDELGVFALAQRQFEADAAELAELGSGHVVAPAVG